MTKEEQEVYDRVTHRAAVKANLRNKLKADTYFTNLLDHLIELELRIEELEKKRVASYIC
jgi:hypothetical protein